MHTTITLIIAHAHTLFIKILQRSLLCHPGFCILGEATSAAELQKLTAALKADVILTDIALPDMNLGDLQQIAASRQAKVIISWWQKDKQLMKGAIDACFQGYIIQNALAAQYKDAVQTVHRGKTFRCIETEKLAGTRRKGTPADPRFKPMTSEKYQLIAYGLLLGHSIAEMAIVTRLTVQSTKTYKQRLKNFLGTLSNASLIEYLKMAAEGEM